MDEPSNQELVDRARRGDRDVLNVLVERWYPIVWGLLFRLSRDWNLAWDLAQDVFFAFCRQEPFRAPLNLNAPQLVAWLRTTALRVWNHYQCNPRQRGEYLSEGQLAEIISRESEPMEKADQDELLTRLRIHIQSLTPKQREVIELLVREELTFEQMAERLSVPAVTLRGLAFRARATLLNRIAADPELIAWLNEMGWYPGSE